MIYDIDLIFIITCPKWLNVYSSQSRTHALIKDICKPGQLQQIHTINKKKEKCVEICGEWLKFVEGVPLNNFFYLWR